MKIVTVKDKRLKALVKGAKTVKGFSAKETIKIIDMIAALKVMTSARQLPAEWKPHFLKPSRPDTLSLTVTGNYRLTSRIDDQKQEISDLDYEDYY